MNFLRGVLTQLIIIPTTVILIVPMMITALIKVLVPVRPFRRFCTRIVIGIAEIWAWVVPRTFRALHHTRYEISGDLDVDCQHSYMLICNHQTWVDIPVLLEVFDGRMPFYRFFLKKELIWLPLLGMAFWALEYPFMKRYSRAYLEKHPEKRGEDLKATKIACDRMRGLPATIINYPEGTRFTRAKHEKQGSPHRNLLRPRAGGISFVLTSMNDQLDSLIDVTIRYPDGIPGFWHFLANGVSRIQVHVRKLPIPVEMTQGDYQNDPEFRERFQEWVNRLWEEKDQLLEEMKKS
ncbi:acyltransferase [Natronospira bacteriovora]|uniref:Acyltransferase n=1 Tax=Natronospira bacteriovora TaxID=3069753 RepID=A0ABU0W6I8_9GAMM|nr:acyltransferase [Natronospira sp. AB-CW4]MDQ2069616.1 acyltransferase [Natronospira sp. AB-CW4]